MFCFRIAMTEKEQTTSSSKLGGLWGYFSNPLNTASSSMWSGGLFSDPSTFWKSMPWIKNFWYKDPSPIPNCVFCLPQLPQDWEENVVTDKSCYVIFGRNFVRKLLFFYHYQKINVSSYNGMSNGIFIMWTVNAIGTETEISSFLVQVFITLYEEKLSELHLLLRISGYVLY